MLQIKILGGILVLFAGGMAAVSRARFEKKRLAVLDGWLGLLLYIRGQIDCYLMPLDEILALADKTLLSSCMAKKEDTTLSAILASSSPYLDEESRRLLSALVREIGNSYREEQLKRCDFYIDALRTRREKTASELPARLKMGVTLSLCAAVGTAILLW